MRRSIALSLLVLALVPSRSTAQTIPLTEKITQLQGQWMHDATHGTGGICGVTVAKSIAITVSEKEVRIDHGDSIAVIPLSGAETALFDGKTATASLDAGWLKITTRRKRGDYTNVMQETYIVLRGELTVWRVLNVEVADGTQGKIDCGNHHAIVYVRK